MVRENGALAPRCTVPVVTIVVRMRKPIVIECLYKVSNVRLVTNMMSVGDSYTTTSLGKI